MEQEKLTSYTPEAWFITSGRGSLYIDAERGGNVVTVAVCPNSNPNMQADALLIKAAPAQNEALRRLMFWLRDAMREPIIFAREYGIEPPEFPESSINMESWLEKHIYGPAEAAILKAKPAAVAQTELFS